MKNIYGFIWKNLSELEQIWFGFLYIQLLIVCVLVLNKHSQNNFRNQLHVLSLDPASIQVNVIHRMTKWVDPSVNYIWLCCSKYIIFDKVHEPKFVFCVSAMIPVYRLVYEHLCCGRLDSFGLCCLKPKFCDFGDHYLHILGKYKTYDNLKQVNLFNLFRNLEDLFSKDVVIKKDRFKEGLWLLYIWTWMLVRVFSYHLFRKTKRTKRITYFIHFLHFFLLSGRR